MSSGKSLPGVPAMPAGDETILLAEDEEEVRAIVRLALESAGYTRSGSAKRRGGDADLPAARPASIHLLVTDVVMPQYERPTAGRSASLYVPN